MFLILFLNFDVDPELKHTQVSAPDFLCHPVQESLSAKHKVWLMVFYSPGCMAVW